MPYPCLAWLLLAVGPAQIDKCAATPGESEQVANLLEQVASVETAESCGAGGNSGDNCATSLDDDQVLLQLNNYGSALHDKGKTSSRAKIAGVESPATTLQPTPEPTTVEYVRLRSTSATTCQDAGYLNIDSLADCAAAFDALKFEDKQYTALEDIAVTSYAFKPKGCSSSCFNTHAGHFCRTFNKHPTGGWSLGDDTQVLCIAPAQKTTQAPTCDHDTGGTCRWLDCNGSRNSECVSGRCVCPEGKCAVGGACA